MDLGLCLGMTKADRNDQENTTQAGSGCRRSETELIQRTAHKQVQDVVFRKQREVGRQIRSAYVTISQLHTEMECWLHETKYNKKKDQSKGGLGQDMTKSG